MDEQAFRLSLKVYRGAYRKYFREHVDDCRHSLLGEGLAGCKVKYGIVTGAQFWRVMLGLGRLPKFRMSCGALVSRDVVRSGTGLMGAWAEAPPPGKPSPGGILLALGLLGSNASSTLFIGDSPEDIIAARAASVLPVGVSWGYHRADDLVAHGAKHILYEWEDLFEFIRRSQAS